MDQVNYGLLKQCFYPPGQLSFETEICKEGKKIQIYPRELNIGSSSKFQPVSPKESRGVQRQKYREYYNSDEDNSLNNV